MTKPETSSVKPVPEGYHTVTAYLTVSDVVKLIDFLTQAFGAKEMERMPGPDGKITHAEVRIGDSPVMMGQARDQWKARPGTLYLYVEDVDAVYKRAIELGAKSLGEPTNQFYGDRSAGVEDPVGNYWWIATHIEDLSPEEMNKRHEAALKPKE
jgi:PhnB protein